MLAGVTIHPPIANFLQCICAKNYENWLTADKVIAKIARLTFLAHPVACLHWRQIVAIEFVSPVVWTNHYTVYRLV